MRGRLPTRRAPRRGDSAILLAPAKAVFQEPEQVAFLDSSGNPMLPVNDMVQKAIVIPEIRARIFREFVWSEVVVTRVCVLMDPGVTVKDKQNKDFDVQSVVVDLTSERKSTKFEFKKGTYKSVAVGYAEVNLDGPIRCMIYETENGHAACTITRPKSLKHEGKEFKLLDQHSFFASQDEPLEMANAGERIVEISARAKKQHLKVFGLYASEVKQAVLSPDSVEILAVTDVPSVLNAKTTGAPHEACWFAKRIDKSYGIVAECDRKDSRAIVETAYKVPGEFYGDDVNPSPLTLLARLAERFGIPVTVGDSSSLFVFGARVHFTGKARTIFAPSGGIDGHVYLSSMGLCRSTTHVDCMVAFVIDTTAFRSSQQLRKLK